MFLYGLTLQRSAAINCVAYGNFSGPKLHEIVVAHGKCIELLRPDAGGKVISE
jgi:splicing factor 3B subunit 3